MSDTRAVKHYRRKASGSSWLIFTCGHFLSLQATFDSMRLTKETTQNERIKPFIDPQQAVVTKFVYYIQ